MKNSDFYISPYGKKRKQEPNQLVCFMLSFFFALGIAVLIICHVALSV